MGEADALAPLAESLRRGDLDLFGYLDLLAERFDARESEVRAFVPEEGRFERLRRQAGELLELYPDPGVRPALFGVPVGFKDIFHVDGFATGGGSRLPPEELAGGEAESATALRTAGALVLGKTVSTEFAYFAPGPTRNPHRPTHTPGGSSSGSAAAVAAGLCPLALGTQTIGSITRPAAFCGITGYKPSYDRVSRAGVIPLAPSLDHVGPFTVDAAGARLAASVLCSDFAAASGRGSADRRPVLGVPEGPYLSRAVGAGLDHFRDLFARLSEAGYEIRRIAAFADFADVAARHSLIVAAEAARVHRPWFDRYHHLYHAETAELVERGRTISDGALATALLGREELRDRLSKLMDEHGIDLWISPSAPGPAPAGLESTGDPVMNLPWTHAGLPTLGLPSGTDPTGMPLGLQLAARWWHDEALLAWGEGLEGELA